MTAALDVSAAMVILLQKDKYVQFSKIVQAKSKGSKNGRFDPSTTLRAGWLNERAISPLISKEKAFDRIMPLLAV